MKGDKALNVQLNKVLRHQLTGINQHFLHARMAKNWGFRELGKHVYEDSIDLMKEADKLIERILFLEGLPNLQDLGKLLIGEDVPELLKNSLASETAAHGDIVATIAKLEESKDYVSRDLLEHFLHETEERVDFYETQLELVTKLGLPNYLQSAVGELSED
jgi:bacterioferritin